MAAAVSIARWLFNEAASGTTPTTVADSTGNGNTLTIDYSSGDASWTSIASGKGWDVTAAAATAAGPTCSIANITTTGNIGSSLNNANQLSLIMVVDIAAVAASGNVGLFFIKSYSTGGGFFNLSVDNNRHLYVRWGDEYLGFGTAYFTDQTLTAGLHVIVLRVDTTQADQYARTKIRVDSTDHTIHVGGTDIAQNSTLNALNSYGCHLNIFNRDNLDYNPQGKVYYVELFTGYLTDTQVSNAVTALTSNNDADWNSVTAATISGATPSGTLGTTTTATIGATTDQNSGTFYAVVATSSAALSGITATQIKAGQVASGSAAPFSGNAAISSTSPSISISGLTASTTYYYAIVQNNTNGDSNILSTGSFTTAGATAVLSSATPSGTIGTQTTANIGATTTQASGTLYAIASTVQADVTGASAANIKAGQKSGGSAAPFSGNAVVSTTTPSVAITGLTAATLYYYAIIQNNGVDSNIINTGSFTTSAPSPTGPINFDCDTNGAATTAFVPDTGSAARAIIAVLSHEQVNGTRPVASLTIGGVTFTKLADSIYGQGTSYAYTEIWYCFESSISAMGYSPSIAVTATSTGNKFVSGTLFTVADVQQNASLWSHLSDAQAVGTTLNMDLPAGNTWKVVGGATSTIGGNAFTTGAGVTELAGSDRNFNSSGSRAVAFSGTASGSTININTGSTSTNTAMSQTLLAVAFPPLNSRSVSITLRDEKNALLNAKNRRFWTRATLDAVAVDGGSSGISVVCGADGVFTLSGLSIASGAGYLTMSDPSDTSKSHNFYVTFA